MASLRETGAKLKAGLRRAKGTPAESREGQNLGRLFGAELLGKQNHFN